MYVYCCIIVTENGCKSVTPLLVAPVDVRNLHLGEFLTQQCHSLSVTDESLFSLTCQTPKTTNIQGTMTRTVVCFVLRRQWCSFFSKVTWRLFIIFWRCSNPTVISHWVEVAPYEKKNLIWLIIFFTLHIIIQQSLNLRCPLIKALESY